MCNCHMTHQHLNIIHRAEGRCISIGLINYHINRMLQTSQLRPTLKLYSREHKLPLLTLAYPGLHAVQTCPPEEQVTQFATPQAKNQIQLSCKYLNTD